jgi:hypothetical protein
MLRSDHVDMVPTDHTGMLRMLILQWGGEAVRSALPLLDLVCASSAPLPVTVAAVAADFTESQIVELCSALPFMWCDGSIMRASHSVVLDVLRAMENDSVVSAAPSARRGTTALARACWRVYSRWADDPTSELERYVTLALPVYLQAAGFWEELGMLLGSVYYLCERLMADRGASLLADNLSPNARAPVVGARKFPILYAMV